MNIASLGTESSVVSAGGQLIDEWASRISGAIERVGTPCYVSAWKPVAAAVSRLSSIESAVPLRLWLSFKTHPLMPLAAAWLESGRGVEVVSETELLTVLTLGATPDQILTNGVGKHTWLGRYLIHRLRVHFDSPGELDALLPTALANQWRVGIRCHVPGECDTREPQFGGQFGFTRMEAIEAIGRLRAAGADLQSLHFHLGQSKQTPTAYTTALTFVADLCDTAGFEPQIVDCGGGLPSPNSPNCGDALADLTAAVQLATSRFNGLKEIWLENGRFVTEASTVLAIRVIDVKDRPDSRYTICDGGRTNHALAADSHPQALMVPRHRSGRSILTTVCGPTCMTDDRLGRWELPDDVQAGDVLIWPDAGAYHLPWETRFSQGHCAVVWFDEREMLFVARKHEQPDQWAAEWMTSNHG